MYRHVARLLVQESPGGSPQDSARSSQPPKRGSTTSPGPEALSKAAHWLALLVCCHVKAGLAPDGLVLVNDLVQLLYYHGSNVAQSCEDEATDENIHLLSPLVQVRLVMLGHRKRDEVQHVEDALNNVNICHQHWFN